MASLTPVKDHWAGPIPPNTFNTTRTTIVSVEKPGTSARQGGSSKRTLYILIISLSAAVVLAFVAYTYVFVEEDGDLRGPLPEADSTTGTTAPAAESPATTTENATEGETTTTSPATTAPATTTPEAASPDTASPATTAPETTTPEAASPDTTTPDAATPDTTTPETTSPSQ